MNKYKEGEGCSKCGEPRPKVTYQVAYNLRLEYLSLRCRECGFSWTRLPLDHKEG